MVEFYLWKDDTLKMGINNNSRRRNKPYLRTSPARRAIETDVLPVCSSVAATKIAFPRSAAQHGRDLTNYRVQYVRMYVCM